MFTGLATTLGKKTGGVDLGFGWNVRDALRLDRAEMIEAFRELEPLYRIFAQTPETIASRLISMSKVAILGAGAWGTALAVTLARGAGAVTLAVRRAAHLEAMRASGENAVYLPGIKLPPTLEMTDEWAARGARRRYDRDGGAVAIRARRDRADSRMRFRPTR